MSKAGVERFTRRQFEDVLPRHKSTGEQLWQCAGLVDGEYEYYVIVGTVNDKVQIEVRSSIGPDGLSAGNGQNSIRCYLTYYDKDARKWQPLGSKVQTYITRRPGWADRLTDTLRTLYGWRVKAKNCPECGKPRGIFKVGKAGPNHGRVYAKCLRHGGFIWLTEAKEAGK